MHLQKSELVLPFFLLRKHIILKKLKEKILIKNLFELQKKYCVEKHIVEYNLIKV